MYNLVLCGLYSTVLQYKEELSQSSVYFFSDDSNIKFGTVQCNKIRI